MNVVAHQGSVKSAASEVSSVKDPIRILHTDALTGLKSVANRSVQVCLTSPPFYLLRGYGTTTDWPDGWRGELGHERHPNDFADHLLFVFDEVWRVLRDDGCLWVNLADTFNNYFDRLAIDVPSRASARLGDRANAGSVWQTRAEVFSDTEVGAEGLGRINPEASPYRHIAMWPRALVRQMMLPTTREGDIVLDPFAGSGTTGEVAVEMGRKAILIEPSAVCQTALKDRVNQASRKLFY